MADKMDQETHQKKEKPEYISMDYLTKVKQDEMYSNETYTRGLGVILNKVKPPGSDL